MNHDRERAAVQAQVPRLTDEEWERSSDPTPDYNCFAWAAGIEDEVWSPTLLGGGTYWPEGPPAFPTLTAMKAAYAEHKFEECEGPELEEGFVKIAIYTDALGEPRHAARQIEDGTWVSKLGDSVDMWHRRVEAVGGGWYGEPTTYMRRPGDPRDFPRGERPSEKAARIIEQLRRDAR